MHALEQPQNKPPGFSIPESIITHMTGDNSDDANDETDDQTTTLRGRPADDDREAEAADAPDLDEDDDADEQDADNGGGS